MSPNCCFHVFQLVLYDFFAASGPIFLNQWLVASRSPDFLPIIGSQTLFSAYRDLDPTKKPKERWEKKRMRQTGHGVECGRHFFEEQLL